MEPIELDNLMARLQTNKHIHQYHRGKLGKITIWKCELPGCNHYLQHQFLPNKIGLCSVCGNPFIITKKSMRNARPRCNGCVVSKVLPDKSVVNEIGKLLGDDV